MNSLFQDAVPVAKGIFEGLSASAVEDFQALRTAKLDLEDHYNPEIHDRFFRTFGWEQFSAEELGLLPAVISMGGDGAIYDIGFGALSRMLVTSTPIKVVVLNTGAYSNTGGQTSTASFTAQDSDLTRFGVAHIGKHEDRKELGLIAAFHPKVLVVQTNAALQGHFMKNIMELPELQRVSRRARHLHGLHVGARYRRRRGQPPRRLGGGEPHEPGLRPRPAQGRHPGGALLAGRQPGDRQGLDHDHAGVCGRRWPGPAQGHPLHPGGLRPRRGPLQEALPPGQRKRRPAAGGTSTSS